MQHEKILILLKSVFFNKGKQAQHKNIVRGCARLEKH